MKFYIAIEGGASLTPQEIWPDGNAPENPTVEDVVVRIRETAGSPSDFLVRWGMEHDVHVKVEGARAL